MNKVLFFLICTPLLALAQREVITDSVWLEKSCTLVDTLQVCTYSEFTTIEFSDGEKITRKQFIGDSATTVTYLTGRAIDLNRGYAVYAAQVIQKKEMMHALSLTSDALVAVGLPDLFTQIQNTFEGEYFGSATVIEKGKDAVKGEVIKTNAGILRLKFGTFNGRILVLSDKMIRVFSYPATGSTIDLYKVRPNVFTSIDRELTIRFK